MSVVHNPPRASGGEEQAWNGAFLGHYTGIKIQWPGDLTVLGFPLYSASLALPSFHTASGLIESLSCELLTVHVVW
jgi:hypothetical protein